MILFAEKEFRLLLNNSNSKNAWLRQVPECSEHAVLLQGQPGQRGNDADRLPQLDWQPHQHDQHERLQEGGWQEGRGPQGRLLVNRGKFLSKIKQLQVYRIFVGKLRVKHVKDIFSVTIGKPEKRL